MTRVRGGLKGVVGGDVLLQHGARPMVIPALTEVTCASRRCPKSLTRYGFDSLTHLDVSVGYPPDYPVRGLRGPL